MIEMRRIILLAHLIIAALTAPLILMVATSGGLYLIGEKGENVTTEIELPANTSLDFNSDNLDAEVKALIDELNLDYQYEYLRNRGTVVQTRPTSRVHLQFSKMDGVMKLEKKEPDLQASMIELHKGHGPSAFKTYQKFVALCLILVLLSGIWMGLTNKNLRRKTLISMSVGFALFFWLVLS